MMQTDKQSPLSPKLVNWYKVNKRDLPWRNTRDPYIIWISEIILQQTRVAQGMDYFIRFTGRFPDVRTLAEAEEDEVLKYWQGLGYYSRARNLHAAAKTIIEQFNGIFPDKYPDVLSLKGIGEYTAAAIVSFAWNQPYPVVDGNVFRVLSRLFGIPTPIDTGKGKKEFTELAGLIMDKTNAGDHNQAIMEFGALQCTPQNPDCTNCPLTDHCEAFHINAASSFPVKQGKTKTRNRYFHYFHIIYKGKTWIHRRDGKDIWQGLYEFPLIETREAMDFSGISQSEVFRELCGNQEKLTVQAILPDIKHVLSHQVIYATFYRIELQDENKSLHKYRCINENELQDYAVSRLVDIYLERKNL